MRYGVHKRDPMAGDENAVHKSVMVAEVIHYLNPRPGGVYLDATFGSGGHTRAILMREPLCRVIAMDWDMKSLEKFSEPLKAEFGDRLEVIWGNFALLYKVLKKGGITAVDGLLADFGPSQVQLAQRPGFSLYIDSELDMRMSPAHQQVTAADVIAKASEEKLRHIFWQLGQERHAKALARALVAERVKAPIKTTVALAELVARSVPPVKGPWRIHPATRVFQALRIYVNKELANIEALLAISLDVVRPGGTIVCISFHSLEDRLVKDFFARERRAGTLSVLTSSVVMATKDEVCQNPSARSARLRAASVTTKSKVADACADGVCSSP